MLIEAQSPTEHKKPGPWSKQVVQSECRAMPQIECSWNCSWLWSDMSRQPNCLLGEVYMILPRVNTLDSIAIEQILEFWRRPQAKLWLQRSDVGCTMVKGTLAVSSKPRHSWPGSIFIRDDPYVMIYALKWTDTPSDWNPKHTLLRKLKDMLAYTLRRGMPSLTTEASMQTSLR
jgi:hypothetical protein